MLPTRNISKKAKQFKTIQQEFQAKNEILAQLYEPVSPEEYLNLVYGDKEKVILVVGRNKKTKEKGTVLRVACDEVWEYAGKPNIYLPYCSFKNDYYAAKTVEAVKAFVVDIDNVSSISLKGILKRFFKVIPKPSFIINSGKGVHMVYMLKEYLEVRGKRWTVNTLNERIQDAYKGVGGKLDKHPIMQPYRFPGFLTKIGTVASGFMVSKLYDIDELLGEFKMLSGSGAKKKERKRIDKRQILYVPNGTRHFYEWVVRGLLKRPPVPGGRHNSFFALGIVAYKCRREIDIEEILDDIELIYGYMEEKGLNKGYSLDEAYKSFHKGYNQKATLARWEFIADKLGWDVKRNKRNGRSREEHLKIAREIRAIYKREKEERIKELIEKGYSKNRIAQALGISRRALYKYYSHLF